MSRDLLPRAMEVVGHKVDKIQVPAGGMEEEVRNKGLGVGVALLSHSYPLSAWPREEPLGSEAKVAGSPGSAEGDPDSSPSQPPYEGHSHSHSKLSPSPHCPLSTPRPSLFHSRKLLLHCYSGGNSSSGFLPLQCAHRSPGNLTKMKVLQKAWGGA